MSVDIYFFNDYRLFIKARVREEKEQWGIWAKLAKAASCQATYISQAMSGKVQLTPEQMIGLGEFFNLSEEETDFLLLLLEHSRAGTKALRDRIGRKIEKIRKEREDIAKRFQQPRVSPGARENLYYSAWYWAALHIIITIPKYQTPLAISQRLSLSEDFVTVAMGELAHHGILILENGKWKLAMADVHVPKDSPMVSLHHNNWRQRAVLDSANPTHSGIHFTAVYSLSITDFQRLKDFMMDLIEKSRKLVGPSKEETLVCMTCDLFEV